MIDIIKCLFALCVLVAEVHYTAIANNTQQTHHKPTHSPNSLSLCTPTGSTKPNDGSLSSEVMLEAKTIRVGKGGRVNEATELFAYAEDVGVDEDEGEEGAVAKASIAAATRGERGQAKMISKRAFLVPLLRKERAHEQAASSSSSSSSSAVASAISSAKDVESVVFGVGGGTGVDVFSSTSTATSTNAPPPLPALLSRFRLTFDSTDPEFDVDSDPDADLDL